LLFPLLTLLPELPRLLELLPPLELPELLPPLTLVYRMPVLLALLV